MYQISLVQKNYNFCVFDKRRKSVCLKIYEFNISGKFQLSFCFSQNSSFPKSCQIYSVLSFFRYQITAFVHMASVTSLGQLVWSQLPVLSSYRIIQSKFSRHFSQISIALCLQIEAQVVVEGLVGSSTGNWIYHSIQDLPWCPWGKMGVGLDLHGFLALETVQE